MKSNEFLPHFNDELNNIRNLAQEFAKLHPKVASNLNLTAESGHDPHTDRLIESFAYITARTKLKLEDGFEDISTDLLEVIQPDLSQTIPSASIVQFKPDISLSESHLIPKGTRIETVPVENTVCQFKTCYATELLPLEVTQASFYNHTLAAPSLPKEYGHAQACLKIALTCIDEKIKFSELAPEKFRFFISGQYQTSFALHELIQNHTLCIAFKSPNQHKQSSILNGAEHIKMVGLNEEERLMPSKVNTQAYDLLKEYFIMPEKFLFVDIFSTEKANYTHIDNTLEMYFYLDKISLDLEGNVTADNLKLGCTPLINTFKLQANPTPITQNTTETRIMLDSQNEDNYELLAVDSVEALINDKEEIYTVPAAFQSTFINKDANIPFFWHKKKKLRPCGQYELGYGHDTYISLIYNQPELASEEVILNIKAVCSNRNLPANLPIDANMHYLQFGDISAPVNAIQCITPFSHPIRPSNDNNHYWKLISILNTNHLSLDSSTDHCAALKNMLSQLNFKPSSQNRAIIESILDINVKRAVSLHKRDGHMCTISGLEITLELDESRFVGNSAFLFASIMERFFAQYCSINSFTKLTAVSKGKQTTIKKWPPRIGNKVLI